MIEKTNKKETLKSLTEDFVEKCKSLPLSGPSVTLYLRSGIEKKKRKRAEPERHLARAR